MTKIKNHLIKYILITFILAALGIVTVSSSFYIYEKRGEILYKLGLTDEYSSHPADDYWAREILNGGYILHFRHAERDKWIDVQMYDVLESDLHTNGIDDSRYAENDYFSQAVCLNERGKIQAKAMGEHIQHIGLPISTVVSSVSCRGRQTADLAFGGYDSQHRLLVHEGPYNETDADRIRILKEFYGSLPVTSDSNVIVSAHNGVVKKEMFENSVPYLNLEEGGFYIISQRNGKLYLEHEFHNFASFMKIFYDR